MIVVRERRDVMLRKIGTDDIRKKLGEILDCVNLRGDEFVIERKNKPIAGLVPMKKMDYLRAMAKNFLLDFLEEEETDLSDEEAMNIANDAKHRTRKVKKSRKAK